MEHVKFTAMKDGDKEDYAFLNDHDVAYAKGHRRPVADSSSRS